MRARLTEEQIVGALADVPDWNREGDAIVRTVECPDFAAAIAFVVRVGFLAEAKDHHPDIDVRWRTVRLLVTTHDLGGLSEWDFELAAAIDEVAP